MYRFYMKSKDCEFAAFQSEEMKFCCEWLDSHVHKDERSGHIRYGDEKNVILIHLMNKYHVICGEYDKTHKLIPIVKLSQKEKYIMARNLRSIRQRIHEHSICNHMAPILEAIAILEYQFGLYNC